MRLRTRYVLLLSLACAGAQADTPSFEQGIARDPRSGRELYREQHWMRHAGGSIVARLVLYRCADGTTFARKRVDYASARFAPAFALEDARGDHREGLRRAGAPRAYARSGDGERSFAVSGEPLVADAGFDEFIRAHWDALTSGEAVPLAFVLPARGRVMAFRVRRQDRGEIDGRAVERFRLSLPGLLGLVAPHIDVAPCAASRA